MRRILPDGGSWQTKDTPNGGDSMSRGTEAKCSEETKELK